MNEDSQSPASHVAKAPFLNAPYSAYLHRDVPAEDAELTHVGPGTPGGEYLRSFWQPVAFSAELRDLPRAVRILGEDLVVFRDGSGRVGLVEMHCSHRGTSLEYGRIERRGIRCCYHGWLYDVDGKILETPTEPQNSTLRDRLFHGAYPVTEHAGLVFAFMGSPQRQQLPQLPRYDFYSLPGYRVVPAGRAVLPCNWLQIKENIMDPFHTVFLHAIITVQFAAWHAEAPELAWSDSPIGTVAVASRRIGDYIWTRVNDFILPNIHQFATDIDTDHPEQFAVEGPWETKWGVPIDDTHTMIMRLLHVKESAMSGMSPSEQAHGIDQMIAAANIGEQPDPATPYEETQRHPGDYEAQVSQRPIAIHALERLGATDRGITMLRKTLRRGIREVAAGSVPQDQAMEPSEVIETYAHQQLVRIPRKGSADEDRAVLQRVARHVAENPKRFLGSRPDDLHRRIPLETIVA